MERLNYEVLKKSGYTGYILEKAPEKVLQFGEGNFLRAFVDYWFDLANERAGWNGKCCLVQPIAPGLANMINEQEGLYTLYLRGSQNGQKVDDKRVISSVSRCLNPYEEEGFAEMMKVAVSDDLEIIVSNTTEAGIVYDPACALTDKPAASFPGKLTQVLYARYQANKPGIIMLACELIDNNGKELLKCVNQYVDQWNLGEGFKKYVNEDCTFCGSLVDRIVPGRIRDAAEVAALEEKHGYADPLLDVGEVFGLWVIEGDASLTDKLPFHKAGLDANVFVAPDMTPYKKRKVRILNGAHTGFVLGLPGRSGHRPQVHGGPGHPGLHEQDAPGGDRAHPAPGSGGLQELCRRRSGPLQQSFRQPRAHEHQPELHRQVESQKYALFPGVCGGQRQAAHLPDHVLRCLHRLLLQ